MSSRNIPSDKINLRLILVTGKTKDLLFSPDQCAADVTQYVFDNWPPEWVDERRPESNILRLIYHGRFLHGSLTLGTLQLPLGRTTVMHLVSRQSLPEPNSQDNLKKDKRGGSSCCCAIL